MKSPRILIAGIGNIFLGDDAFGVEVAARLIQESWPANIRVVDFGIRGLDLTYALLDGCDVAILIDAVPRGEVPGTLYVIEPQASSVPPDPTSRLSIDPHNMDPARVLQLVQAMGGQVRRILLVGCEPSPLAEADEMQMGLSNAARAAVDEAVPMVHALVETILKESTWHLEPVKC
jgi:hydrogenase maturation protease